ncbi:LL-diaminopimelate aminotransferase [Sporanaerobium hydrogeniformans]|uniref:LL-diaminopimelate aminotransferase n=1 Tax=Sporanaerobium hydrogeniformans TaxID=3072179 RepID=A0AC61DBH7_9FIRM|nr:LL-diaminopimelate aminotransferase [Sporanaerobium hydrogeniformans]PHV70591.1 LL-diaminopimelate aminotransferase [Sporanaerobium hydrogeniformans]
MAFINDHYLELKDSYLFSTIAKKINEFTSTHPDKKLIRMGIGDVTLPLVPAVLAAMHEAVEEMGQKETFKGYGPEQGYDFLHEAIQKYYASRGVNLSTDEIFISDGAKSDIGNITDIFSNANVVMIPDPVYPVYVDTNIMSGRQIEFLDSHAKNNFLPMPPSQDASPDIIYLCSPNNPTGSVYNKEQLKAWVDYANHTDAVILFDAAYECFIQDPSLPRSIFEIEGAKTCAIEFCSLSKTAGFTGTRCGYTIVPKNLLGINLETDETSLNKLWLRRQTTKFNGVPYIIQKGAAAVFSPEGQAQIQKNITYYMENAQLIASTMKEKGIEFVGGDNSPYIWLKCPNGMKSWDFFDYLLNEIAVVGTPGAGFGHNGEGYFRLTAFGSKEATLEAMERFKTLSL